MDFLQLLQKRRSVRTYREEEVGEEALHQILQAGLLYPSSQAKYPVQMIVVQDKEMLAKLSQCKLGGAKMLEKANCAIVVIGDAEKSDCWIEDCSIAMTLMHLQATSLGVGSCWVQCRNRADANTYLRNLLQYPASYQAEAILSLGLMQGSVQPHELPNLDAIHWERY